MNLSPNESDDQLREFARQVAAGDLNALEKIYELTATRLLRYSLFLVKNRGDAEDLVQSIFLKVANAPRNLVYAHHPIAYLFRMTRNEIWDQAYRRKPLQQLDSSALIPDRTATPLDLWEISEAVHDALQELPAIQAEVVTLHIWEGLTFREIAEITGECLNTVTSRYRYGMEKLSRLLKNFGECGNNLWGCRDSRRTKV